jgi:hypothetical protein
LLPEVEVKQAYELLQAKIEAEKSYIKNSKQYHLLGTGGTLNYQGECK